MSISDVQEIIDLEDEMLHPPGLPQHFKGILNLRGDLVTIVDTRKMYSMPAIEECKTPKVLIMKTADLHFGLIVDSVDAIVTFCEHQRMKLPKVLYHHSTNKMTEDVQEAVEVEIDESNKKSLLILSPNSIALRVSNKQAA